MRLTALGVARFQHEGVIVDAGWTELDYAKADARAQQAFRSHVGVFIKIHPDDVGELASVGLALDAGRIVEMKAKAKAK